MKYRYKYVMYFFIGCNIGFYGENCRKCPNNCLNDTCQFRIGHCFGCKDGFQGEMCEEGKKLLVCPTKSKNYKFSRMPLFFTKKFLK